MGVSPALGTLWLSVAISGGLRQRQRGGPATPDATLGVGALRAGLLHLAHLAYTRVRRRGRVGHVLAGEPTRAETEPNGSMSLQTQPRVVSVRCELKGSAAQPRR